MDCPQIKPALLDYLLEEASPAERGELEAHLKSCAPCSQEMAELKQTLAVVARAEVSEELPRKIRLVAEPQGRWGIFWRNPARLAFAGAGLLCLAIAMLALFRTNISYQHGNFQIAFGVPAAATTIIAARPSLAGNAATVSTAQALNRDQVNEMISQALANIEAERRKESGLLAKDVSQQMEQKWQQDLREMAASLRIFQSAQTVMWKEQVQNQQRVGTLMQRAGLTTSSQP